MFHLLMKMLKSIFQFIKEHFETIYLLVISIFWICLFVYFRFVKSREGYDLQVLKHNVSEYVILINIGFIMLHIMLILYAIYKIIIIRKENHKPSNFMQSIQKVVNILFVKPFIRLRDLIAPHIPGSGLLFCKITEKIDTFVQPEHRSLSMLKTPVITFSIMPRIVVALIFFIEIMLLNQIHYFIPSLLLLLIPIMWNIFVSLYVRFAEEILVECPKYVKIIGIGEPDSNGWYARYTFQPLPQFKYEGNDLKEHGDTYIIGIKMYAFGAGTSSFKHYQNLLTPYSTLLTSSLYLTAGIYKLIFVLF